MTRTDLALVCLPSDLETELRSLGYVTVEQLYAGIVGSPDSFAAFFSQHGVQLDGVREKMELLLPTDVKALLSAPVPHFPLGGLPPKSPKQ